MKGMLNRIEDGWAVILIEEEQKELLLPVSHLPEGSEVNSWFEIELDGDKFCSISLDEESRAVKEKEARDLRRRLRRRSGSSRFKRR